MSDDSHETGSRSSRGGKKSGGRRQRLAASHQRSWLWGRHAVMEMLEAGRWPVTELLIAANHHSQNTGIQPASNLIETARMRADQLGLTIQWSTDERLSQLCGSPEHQGFLARMGEFPCGDFQDWNQFLDERMRQANTIRQPDVPTDSGEPALPPVFLICDRIQDSHNFGAILRSCDGIRVDAVVTESAGQAMITPHVARASAGAVNYLNLFRVNSLAEVVESLRAAGVRIVAASEKADNDLWNTPLTSAIALIVGSEAAGIRRELQQMCDLSVSIPMLGGIDSLNAAVAAGILLYEIRRQQIHA